MTPTADERHLEWLREEVERLRLALEQERAAFRLALEEQRKRIDDLELWKARTLGALDAGRVMWLVGVAAITSLLGFLGWVYTTFLVPRSH